MWIRVQLYIHDDVYCKKFIIDHKKNKGSRDVSIPMKGYQVIHGIDFEYKNICFATMQDGICVPIPQELGYNSEENRWIVKLM